MDAISAVLTFFLHSRCANIMSWHYWTILFGRGPGKKYQRELENISLWLKIYELALNIKKTHFIVFQRGKAPVSHLDIKLIINPLTEFLWVVIDSKVSWKNHMCLVSGKLSKSIGMIIKAREYLNRNALLTLYYSFVYPYLTYCNRVWDCTYHSNLKLMIVLQKKALRIMCGKSRREPTENIFSYLKIIKFTNINTYLTGMFMCKIYKKNAPEIFTSFCSLVFYSSKWIFACTSSQK